MGNILRNKPLPEEIFERPDSKRKVVYKKGEYILSKRKKVIQSESYRET